MTEGIYMALIAAVGGLVTMGATKLADAIMDRRTNWRQESKAIRTKQEQDYKDLSVRLAQCEDYRTKEEKKYENNRLGQERRINDLLNKIGFLEYRVQSQEYLIEGQNKKIMEQDEKIHKQEECIARFTALLATRGMET